MCRWLAPTFASGSLWCGNPAVSWRCLRRLADSERTVIIATCNATQTAMIPTTICHIGHIRRFLFGSGHSALTRVVPMLRVHCLHLRATNACQEGNVALCHHSRLRGRLQGAKAGMSLFLGSDQR